MRFRVSKPPILVEYCHCGMCRRAGGAPVAAWVDFPAEGFSLISGTIAKYASSPGSSRGFCATCGSSLLFQRGEAPPFVSVALGSLDDAALLPPVQHIFVADRLTWFPISDELPQYTHWPANA